MSERIQAVRGMNDVLPDQAHWWERFEDVVRDWLHDYGYRNIRMPVLECTDLFVRSIGEVTDIVEKEMYTFADQMNGESLTLRPEGTASCVRAVIEHNLLYNGAQRLCYMGPMFRHERPQKGRYRQFHQVGVEALGYGGPDIDAEHIVMCARLWQNLGIGQVNLEINTLGDSAARGRFRARLIGYFEQHADVLDADARRRLHSNPLRILDTKNPAMQSVVEAAPRLLDFLGEASLAHFNAVKAILDANGVVYSINPRLVRGMDYYNLTVFEFITTSLGSQGTICGGGRYDYLVEQVGGKPSPAVGWALGVERVLELVKEQGEALPDLAPDVYAIIPETAALPVAMQVLQTLRACGLSAQMHAGASGGGGDGMGSIKSQFKKADGSGARFALIFGADELAQGRVAIKSLRDGEGAQRTESLSDVAAWAHSLQSSL